MAEDTLYEVLGVSPTSSSAEIDAAYKRLVRLTHPDAGGSDFLFRRVHEAHATLSDPVKRRAYDASLRDPATSDPPDSDSTGWVRVDDPPPGWSSNPGEADATSDYGSPWNNAPPPPASQPWSSGPYPPTSTAARSGSGQFGFVAARPWLALLVAALVLAYIAPTLGVLIFIVGGIAAIGSRRAARRHALRYADSGAVDAMDGIRFEHYVGELLRREGYRVRLVGQTHDFGADLLVERGGRRVVVQTKRYSNSVGVGAVREAAAARAHYGADDAIVVTNSFFTGPAVQLARSNRVELWDRTAVADMARRSGGQPTSPISLLGSELAAGMSILFGFLGALFTASGSTGRRRRRRSRRW